MCDLGFKPDGKCDFETNQDRYFIGYFITRWNVLKSEINHQKNWHKKKDDKMRILN